MPDLPDTFWIGTDEDGGIPNPGRPDVAPPPRWRLEAIAHTDRPRQIELSPDGNTIAFMLDRDTSDVWVIDVAGGAPHALTTGRTLTAYWADGTAVWSPDGLRLAYTHDGNVMVVPAKGGPPTTVCAGSSPVWIDDARMVIGVDRGPSGNELTELAVVDADDPWPARLAGGHGFRADASVSPDGRRVVSTLFHRDDLNSTSLHVTDIATGDDQVVAHTPGRHVRAPAWSPDGRHIAYTDESPGWYEIFVVDVGGSMPATVQQVTGLDGGPGYDHVDLRWTADGRSLLAVRFRHGVGDLVRVDVDGGALTVLAPGGTWSAPRELPDGSVVGVHEAHDTPARICRVDVDRTVTELFAPAPLAVSAAPHVVPEHVSYASLDGMEVYGWLYRPPSATSTRPAPAIVYPHGGPTSYTGDEWDGVAQYFLDQGYAWFSVNYRGSTTYGREFERANHGVWGVSDTEDCLAAADHLASLDWVDASRLGIFGSSYGSYMALHSLVDDPEHRYVCGVAKYGDCDIVTSWAQSDLVGRLDLERMMGHPSDHADEYRAGSPIHRVEQMTAPIFIAHGDRDDRVHPAQSVELVAALRRRGKTFEYVTYPTEGHGLLRAGPMVHFYGRLARFFHWYLR